jgi:hypothetical protein
MNRSLPSLASLALFAALCAPLAARANGIPAEDRKRIMAHSVDGNDNLGAKVELPNLTIRNHHNDDACKVLYKGVNKKEGTEAERAEYVKNLINVLSNEASAFKSPNGKCECRYSQNMIVIYNSAAYNRGTAFCQASKAAAKRACQDMRDGKDLQKLTNYGCAEPGSPQAAPKAVAKPAPKGNGKKPAAKKTGS